MASSAIRFIACTVTLFIVVCARRRREAFIILTPIFLMVADVFSFIGVSIILTVTPEEFVRVKTTVNLLFTINNFFALMSYQVFGAQYLRTSLVLPSLFHEAKLEWVLSEAQGNRLSESKLGLADLRDELNNTDLDTSRSFVTGEQSIQMKALSIIKRQKECIKRIE